MSLSKEPLPRGIDHVGGHFSMTPAALPIARLVAYVSFVLVAAPFLYHLTYDSTAYLGLFHDDYFYYTGVADNLVQHGRLTYDGIHLTNGFHPLWFSVIALIRLIFGRFDAPFYLALTAFVLASLVVTYEMSVRFARALGVAPAAAAVFSAMYAVGTARLMTSGMEAVLAIPLLLWLFVETIEDRPLTARRSAWLGFLASLAILARLDVAIAVALLLTGYLFFVRPPFGVAARRLLAFASGGVLLPLYLIANLLAFGTPMPVSALAKQLYSGIGFNVGYAKAVALASDYGPTVGVLLPLGIAALFVLGRRSPDVRRRQRFIGAIALVFAFTLFGMNALSGWAFFPWYAYPIAPAAIAASAFVWEVWGPLISARRGAALALATIALVSQPVLAATYFWQHGPEWKISDNTLLANAYELKRQVGDREGVFGMGAIAGFVAYVMDRPVVQLEGIMADRRMVDRIGQEAALEDVLEEYGVDYLVVSLAFNRSERRNGCYTVTQPNENWAGKRTRKLRGEICEEPIAHFITPRGAKPWSAFPDVETLVWDVRGARWRRDGNLREPR